MKFWTLMFVAIVLAFWCWANGHPWLASLNVCLVIACICQRGGEQCWSERIELRFQEHELRRTNREVAHLRSMPDRDWADNIALIAAKKEQTRLSNVIARLRWDIYGQIDGVDYTLEMEL